MCCEPQGLTIPYVAKLAVFCRKRQHRTMHITKCAYIAMVVGFAPKSEW